MAAPVAAALPMAAVRTPEPAPSSLATLALVAGSLYESVGAQGFLVMADAINRAGSTEPAKIQAALKATDLKPIETKHDVLF